MGPWGGDRNEAAVVGFFAAAAVAAVEGVGVADDVDVDGELGVLVVAADVVVVEENEGDVELCDNVVGSEAVPSPPNAAAPSVVVPVVVAARVVSTSKVLASDLPASPSPPSPSPSRIDGSPSPYRYPCPYPFASRVDVGFPNPSPRKTALSFPAH